MKSPSDLTEAEETASAPQPFNLFAGLSEEQLPASTVQTNVPASIPPAEPQRTTEMVPNRSATVYWVLAMVALLIAIVLAIL